MVETLLVKERKEWRRWLKENHLKKKEIWLVYYKKHTGKPSIPYDDAVEEAICFGWIDGKVRSINSEKYMQRYTPRKPKSNWSFSNKKRVSKLIALEKMTPAGMTRVEDAKKYGEWDAVHNTQKVMDTPDDLKEALTKNAKAQTNFNRHSDAYRNHYIWWIMNAKTEKTRKRRIQKTVEFVVANKKYGEK